MPKIGMSLTMENVVKLLFKVIEGTKYETTLYQFKKKKLREFVVHGTKVS
jgi:hypothetical protein